MNTRLLKIIMAAHDDTQSLLAAEMGLSLSRLNAKINERNGAAFTQSEISFIIKRYNLTGATAMDIFFAAKVS